MITTIAVLQLVEQGKLKLDEPIEQVLPEIAKVQVLEDDGTLRPPHEKITLRMLLTHTAGFTLVGLSPKLAQYYQSDLAKGLGHGPDARGTRDILTIPLIAEPGTVWTYGQSLEWVGEAIERVSGKRLGVYLEENIFHPLGITDISFNPPPEQRARLVANHVRGPDGKLVLFDYSYAPWVTTGAEYDQGGSGLFGTLRSFLAILAVILNGGASPSNGARVLKEETVKSMFVDQAEVVPKWRDIIHAGGMDLQATAAGTQGPPRGWGLSFQLNLTELASGRTIGSASWLGAPGMHYTIDPTKGIATAFFSQALPFLDPIVHKVFLECETVVYSHL